MPAMLALGAAAVLAAAAPTATPVAAPVATLATELAAAPAPVARLRPMAGAEGRRVSLVADGPLTVRAFRLTSPSRLVLELRGATLVGDRLRLPPGLAWVHGVALVQAGPALARAVFFADDPARLRWRAEPLGPRHTRVLVEAAPHPALVAAAAGGGAGAAGPDWPLGAAPGTSVRVVPAVWRPVAPERAGRRLAALARSLAARRPASLPGLVPARPGGVWRSGSQLVASSNVARFGPGEPAVGVRHRLGGQWAEPAAPLRGWLVGHLDAQVLRFGDPRLDHVNTLGSLALAHGVGPGLHVFEGLAGLHRKEAYASTINELDASLFVGAGRTWALPGGGLGAVSLVVDRVTAPQVRHSYYGQALRLRGLLPLGPTLGLAGQATAQRLDPVVRSQAFYRTYADLALEWAPAARARLGLAAQLGLQLRGGAAETYVQAGPQLVYVF